METKPRRPWLQFSLKSLLVITLLVACFLGGMASMANRMEELLLFARKNKEGREKADKELRDAYEEEFDFRERHGLPGGIRLRDLDLNEWGEWHPKPGINP